MGDFSFAHEMQEQTVAREVRDDQAVAVSQDPVVDDLERSYALHRLRAKVDEATQRGAPLFGVLPQHVALMEGDAHFP